MSFKTEPMELGEEEGGKVECDLRRCTLCGVSGDAPCIVSGVCVCQCLIHLISSLALSSIIHNNNNNE